MSKIKFMIKRTSAQRCIARVTQFLTRISKPRFSVFFFFATQLVNVKTFSHMSYHLWVGIKG